MATRISFVFPVNFLLNVILVSLCLNSYLKRIHGFQGNETAETQQQNHLYHTIQLTSLLPSSVCESASTKAHNRKSSLKVIHKHGPCFHGNDEKPKLPSLKEILHQDQLRVKAIHSRIAKKNTGRGDIKESKATTLPDRDGRSYGVGNYIVTVGLGTPKKDFSLVFDTGSYLTWTQCEPCSESNCYPQKEPKFDPTMSQTYANVTCTSPACNSAIAYTGKLSCASSTCIYSVGYGDKSYSVGFLATETLTLTPTDVFPNFIFGCGQKNQGRFGSIAGLLGLSQDSSSLVLQTAEKYKKLFSYCLPSSPSSTGHLTFGNTNGVPDSVKFTPLSAVSKGPSFYGINIIGLIVGGKRLPIDSSVFTTAGAIIDSGTTITYLPQDAYSALRSTFRQMMEKYPLASPADDFIDTCYDVSGNSTVTPPSISFIFDGDVEVNIDPSGIFIANGESQICLAFAGNRDSSDMAIFGNTQQRTLEVVYDVAGGRIGFAAGGCS